MKIYAYRQYYTFVFDSPTGVASPLPNPYRIFGLGADEGMAAGTPVMATNYTALLEVRADAGLIVDVPRTVSMRRRYIVSALLRARWACRRMNLLFA